ncbi:MAG: RHS repeat-associated core domain-containing protein [Thermoplasmatota archaeon]
MQFSRGAGHEPLAIDHQTPAGWQRLYYEQDANGDVTALTNRNAAIVEGYLYEAYGKPVIVTPGPNGRVDWGNDDVTATASAVDNPYLYTGQRYDADTGLYYYRARKAKATSFASIGLATTKSTTGCLDIPAGPKHVVHRGFGWKSSTIWSLRSSPRRRCMAPYVEYRSGRTWRSS